MQIAATELARLREIVTAKSNQNIVIIAHTNPDGDALGSTLAWARILRDMGHSVSCIAPNKYPYFMEWMEGIKDYIIHKTDSERAESVIAKSDIIFCMDFNTTSRLEALGCVIDANTTAKRVLIDHHLSPAPNFDVVFSFPEESSTCFVTYSLIEAFVGAKAIDPTTADLLYTGIMTDTGNFSFSNLSPELFRAVAVLVEQGANIPQINLKVYNSYSEGRIRLFGYIVNRNMEIIEDGRVAYMSLTEVEMRRHNFQQGDSEGFVNYPLSVEKMLISALFTAHRKFIRVSLRSRSHIDVNLFARKYFNGGGHKNAAGGKSELTMEETIEKFRSAIKEFMTENNL
ncbi:MAG: bifunctional oligoribonuclease/PAP phosphatase NrnA [Rikenellaceae bacterium]